ncbi:RDD family protein [Sanguibacter suaedae]|uniref:RDD family protein n=1 Tax=Sanguibacter suaedae TaxID=2795737 RepID=A0A934I8N3_9MICO|nr:RDD family protein [Sanguibacter suaedae]MBI9113436.1 RDD family protein [Sanguibacter suaedae]
MSFVPPPPPPAGAGAPGASALAGCRPAEPGRRVGAAVVDSLLSAIPSGAAVGCIQVGLVQDVAVLVVVGSVLALGWTAGLVTIGLSYARTGASPGKRAMGLRLVDVRTGAVPGFGGTWPRFFAAVLGGAVLVGWVTGVVQVLRNPRGDRRTWYDTMTDVVLLDVVAGRDPAVLPDARTRTLPARRSKPAHDDADGQGPASQFADVPVLVSMDGSPLHPHAAGGPDGGGPVSPLGGPPVPPPPPGAAEAGVPGLGTPHPGPGATSASHRPVPLLDGHPHAVPGAAPADGPVDDLEETRVTVARTRRPGTPSAPTPAVASAQLTFDTGDVEDITGRGVIGRRPQLPEGTGGADGGTAITVPDTTRTVSKTHLEFVVEETGLRVTDLWSTNGSTVVGADGDQVPLPAGEAVLAPFGSTVTVGDHWFTVTRPRTAASGYDEAGDTILRGSR